MADIQVPVTLELTVKDMTVKLERELKKVKAMPGMDESSAKKAGQTLGKEVKNPLAKAVIDAFRAVRYMKFAPAVRSMFGLDNLEKLAKGTSNKMKEMQDMGIFEMATISTAKPKKPTKVPSLEDMGIFKMATVAPPMAPEAGVMESLGTEIIGGLTGLGAFIADALALIPSALAGVLVGILTAALAVAFTLVLTGIMKVFEGFMSVFESVFSILKIIGKLIGLIVWPFVGIFIPLFVALTRPLTIVAKMLMVIFRPFYKRIMDAMKDQMASGSITDAMGLVGIAFTETTKAFVGMITLAFLQVMAWAVKLLISAFFFASKLLLVALFGLAKLITLIIVGIARLIPFGGGAGLEAGAMGALGDVGSTIALAIGQFEMTENLWAAIIDTFVSDFETQFYKMADSTLNLSESLKPANQYLIDLATALDPTFGEAVQTVLTIAENAGDAMDKIALGEGDLTTKLTNIFTIFTTGTTDLTTYTDALKLAWSDLASVVALSETAISTSVENIITKLDELMPKKTETTAPSPSEFVGPPSPFTGSRTWELGLGPGDTEAMAAAMKDVAKYLDDMGVDISSSTFTTEMATAEEKFKTLGTFTVTGADLQRLKGSSDLVDGALATNKDSFLMTTQAASTAMTGVKGSMDSVKNKVTSDVLPNIVSWFKAAVKAAANAAVAGLPALPPKPVGDAIITPSGQVIQTSPADYIMAMTNPEKLAGMGGGGGNVTINLSINATSTDSKTLADQISKELQYKLRNRSLYGY